MPRVAFTSHLQRHGLDCSTQQVEGHTVREALEAVFAQRPALRGYILDDQQRLRPHVVIFLDGEPTTDRMQLGERVLTESEIYVMQALSGG
ncbi:MAG TPA: MoaD/ThiS family protein [Planctomycetaceae bacterium]|nr:MoaD/ThiS family protein [Planctomycetaceae bacterium]